MNNSATNQPSEDEEAAGFLPRIPSELLKRALEDFDACVADRNYHLDMRKSHDGHNLCSVCLAGAVMAKSLHAPRDKDCVPEHFPGDAGALDALDHFRQGSIRAGLDSLDIDYHRVTDRARASISVPGLTLKSRVLPMQIDIEPYSPDSPTWRAQMQTLVQMFVDAGI